VEIDAKVAKVLSDRRIAINIGSRNGVNVGDSVVFYEDVDVADPDTSEPLGSVRLRRLTMDVELVQDRLSVAVVRLKKLSMNQVVMGRQSDEPEIRISEGPTLDSQNYYKINTGDPVSVIIRTAEKP
jgi:hypothetical protein